MFLLAYLKVFPPISTTWGLRSLKSRCNAPEGQCLMQSPHRSHRGGPSYIGVGVSSASVTIEMKRTRLPNSGVMARPDQPISARPAAVAAWMCDRSGANRLGMPSYWR